MKFGETFSEYLHGDQEWFLDKCSHVEYKQLKKVLKRCQTCRLIQGSSDTRPEDENSELSHRHCESCPRTHLPLVVCSTNVMRLCCFGLFKRACF